MKSVLLMAVVWATGAGLQESATVGLKMIAVTTESEAVGLKARLDAGEFFDELARSYSVDASGADGGYVGQVNVADLREEFRSVLTGLPPGKVSAVTRVGEDFVLLMAMTDRESRWIARLEAGLRAKAAGDYEAAQRDLDSAVADAETFGLRHPHLARSLHNLALLHQELGNYAAAEPLHRRALAIWEDAFGPGHVEVAITLNNLAELYREQGDLTAAESLYQRALPLAEQPFGPDHPNLGQLLNNMALLYLDRQDYDAAEPLYLRALAIWEQALGPEHPNVGLSLGSLASLYRARGQYDRAEPLYLRALEIAEASFGAGHPDVVGGRNNLGVEFLNVAREAKLDFVHDNGATPAVRLRQRRMAGRVLCQRRVLRRSGGRLAGPAPALQEQCRPDLHRNHRDGGNWRFRLRDGSLLG